MGHNVLFLFNNYMLDCQRRELRAGDVLVALEPQVFDLLVYLIENRDRVVSKDDLIASVWAGRIVSESTLTSRINAVRRAIGDTGEKQSCIRTFARKGFRFVALVEATDTAGQMAGVEAGPALALPQKPSIAVLPFSNMSGDAADDSFADVVTEEIITALSRVRWFFVIARGSAFAYKSRDIDPNDIARELGVRYILMGSVRRAGDRIRVTAKLIDGSNGSRVWARSYDRALSDIFSVQDDITQTIVGGIEPELGRAERERARVKHRDSIDAWSTYQRGMIHLYRIRRTTSLKLAGSLPRQLRSTLSSGLLIPPPPRPITTKWCTDLPNRSPTIASAPSSSRKRLLHSIATMRGHTARSDERATCAGSMRQPSRSLNSLWTSIRASRLRTTVSAPLSCFQENRTRRFHTWNPRSGLVRRIPIWAPTSPV